MVQLSEGPQIYFDDLLRSLFRADGATTAERLVVALRKAVVAPQVRVAIGLSTSTGWLPCCSAACDQLSGPVCALSEPVAHQLRSAFAPEDWPSRPFGDARMRWHAVSEGETLFVGAEFSSSERVFLLCASATCETAQKLAYQIVASIADVLLLISAVRAIHGLEHVFEWQLRVRMESILSAQNAAMNLGGIGGLMELLRAPEAAKALSDDGGLASRVIHLAGLILNRAVQEPRAISPPDLLAVGETLRHVSLGMRVDPGTADELNAIAECITALANGQRIARARGAQS